MFDAHAFWDQKAEIFALREKQQGKGRFGEFYEACCWHYIAPLLPSVENSRILEAGCGIGRWVFHLAEAGYCVELLDLSKEMIRHAAERVRQKNLQHRVAACHTLDICDMHALPDNRFDFVLALGAPLSLCDHPETAVDELSRVTKAGGYILWDAANQYQPVSATVCQNDGSRLSSLMQILNAAPGRGKAPHKGAPARQFRSRELEDLFTSKGLKTLHLAAVCPLCHFPPTEKEIAVLNDKEMFRTLREFSEQHAEDPDVIALSGRLMIVAQKR
jgi:SAM-dependent methyltransferase